MSIFPLFVKKQSKTHLLSVKKIKKVADNKAQFELKIAYFHVFQGKIEEKKSKLHLLLVQKVEKVAENKAEKSEIYQKSLKNTLIIGLKSQKSGG